MRVRPGCNQGHPRYRSATGGRTIGPPTDTWGRPHAVNDLDRSDFLFRAWTISVAIVTVVITLLLAVAALSPEVSVDVPGLGRGFNGGGD